MRITTIFSSATILTCAFARPFWTGVSWTNGSITYKSEFKYTHSKPFAILEPKVFIINMFRREADSWLTSLDFHHNITIPGLSSFYPKISCTTNYSVCDVITGEGDINAAASIMALGLSPLFDLSRTYFLISGIARGEPNLTTLGSVTFAKYAVQAALEYEAQDVITPNPSLVPRDRVDAHNTWAYPGRVTGTEVFEANENLRDRAVELACSANLEIPTRVHADDRFLYGDCAARVLPSIVKCDVLSADNYFTGSFLSDYFSFYASSITNGSAKYCSTAQEDNGSLEALTRLDRYSLVDFDRVVVSRSIAAFTRPPISSCNDTVTWFNNPDASGSSAAFANLPIAGLPFVRDVLENWEEVYYAGDKYARPNYKGVHAIV